MSHERQDVEGVVKFYNAKSKFGFVRVADTGEEIYFNHKALGSILVNDGDAVVFDVGRAKRGLVALNIRLQS